jgi:HAD superfamily hydrolase (TIGR01509 family)
MREFPGVTKLLQLLDKNGVKAAIGSSAPLENINVILNGLGISGYFQAIVYGQEVKESKPSPQVYQLAARKLGAEPQNCIVIEDAVAGVTAAKRGGMHCIAVTNSHPAEALSQADLVVDSLEKVDLGVLDKVYSSKSG